MNVITYEARFIFVVIQDLEIVVNQNKVIHKYTSQYKYGVESLMIAWGCKFINTSGIITDEYSPSKNYFPSLFKRAILFSTDLKGTIFRTSKYDIKSLGSQSYDNIPDIYIIYVFKT